MPFDALELATEGAEAEVVEKAALARLTGVGYALGRAGLRPLVEKHDSRTIDDVRLYIGDVQHLLNLRHANYVVVRGAPDLNNMVVLVVGMRTSRADAIAHAVQAEEVTLASLVEHPCMERAIKEETSLQHWLQPGRPDEQLRLSLLLIVLIGRQLSPSSHLLSF